MMNGVGGSSIHYGIESGVPAVELQGAVGSIARYGASAIPSNSTVADWPIAYEDLEP